MSNTADKLLTLVIARKQEIADGITALELRDPAGTALPHFTPGAHITTTTPCGLQRDYSIANADEDDDYYEIAVQRERDGRGSSSLIDETHEGDTLEVSWPKNDFPMVPSSDGYVFIAGGIGLTPILSMIRSLERSRGASFELYYCTRSPEQTAYLDEINALATRGRATIHHDGGDPERMFDFWPVVEQCKGRHLYCCGPRPLMREIQDMTGHWPSANVHFEAFTKAEKRVSTERAFNVRLARSDRVVEIPSDASILETLRAHGLELRSSCESGTCGTCRTTLLAGEPDHRDFVLHDDERTANVMICVSRSKSDELVLDL